MKFLKIGNSLRLAALLCLLPVMGFAKPKAVAPSKPKPVAEEVSRDALRGKVLEIQALARAQQYELDRAISENSSVKAALEDAKLANITAQQETDALQLEVDKVTLDRNEQAKLKDEAVAQVASLETTVKKQSATIHKLKFILCFEAAGLALLLCLWLRLPSLAPPYGILGTASLVGGVFVGTWLFL